VTAEILSVGTELLLGDVLDTNATYLSREAARLGLSVLHRQTVGDNPDRLRRAVALALSRADVVMLCGGLGPTPDDLTKEIACEALGVPLALHEESLARIEGYFRRSGRVMSDNNRKQAMLPVGCTVFHNDNGTAPGCAVEKGGKHVLLFPGTPRELVPMFEQSAVPYLQAFCDGVIVSHSVKVFGLGESTAAQMVGELMASTNPTVAPYAKDGEMYFRVTAKAADENAADDICRPMIDALCDILGKAVYGVDVASLEEALVRTLTANGQTVASAESCTGGLISQRITAVSGASAVFGCGVAAYSADVKHRVLQVPQEVIDAHGTVSAQTAAAMAKGVRVLGGANFGVSVTGAAGPSPCEGHPVGTVFVGLATASGTYAKRLNLTHRRDRDYIRTVAASHALHAVLCAAKGCLADGFEQIG